MELGPHLVPTIVIFITVLGLTRNNLLFQLEAILLFMKLLEDGKRVLILHKVMFILMISHGQQTVGVQEPLLLIFK